MSKATVTSKGQLTVPVDVRRALGLERGDLVVFDVRGDEAVLRKATDPSALRGSVTAKRIPWKDARRQAWRTRAERLGRSSATRTSSSGS